MEKSIIATLLASMMLSPAFAGEPSEGLEIYKEHCAICHGKVAQGDGPISGALMIKPKNLARLTADNNGAFPLERVIKRIDGRDPLVSHGSPMPVYGHYFDGQDVTLRTDAGQPVFTSQPIDDLISWLKKIQG